MLMLKWPPFWLFVSPMFLNGFSRVYYLSSRQINVFGIGIGITDDSKTFVPNVLVDDRSVDFEDFHRSTIL